MYPFGLGDLRDGSICLLNYMESAPSKIPWVDLQYIFGQIIWGGHIVNDNDRLLAMTYQEVSGDKSGGGGRRRSEEGGGRREEGRVLLV